MNFWKPELKIKQKQIAYYIVVIITYNRREMYGFITI